MISQPSELFNVGTLTSTVEFEAIEGIQLINHFQMIDAS